MNRTYQVLTQPGFSGDWSALPAASVDCNPWREFAMSPPAQACVAFDGSMFHVQLKAWERNLRVVTHECNGPVWEDSCVEFFLNPSPLSDKRYMNFEMNAEGVLLLGFGPHRDERELLDFDPAQFSIRADVPPYGAEKWDKAAYAVEFAIPVSFLERLYGKLDLRPGARMAGNFQKCGDKTSSPHFGCWNPIGSSQPDFHLPEFFGDLIIV